MSKRRLANCPETEKGRTRHCQRPATTATTTTTTTQQHSRKRAARRCPFARLIRPGAAQDESLHRGIFNNINILANLHDKIIGERGGSAAVATILLRHRVITSSRYRASGADLPTVSCLWLLLRNPLNPRHPLVFNE